MKISHFLALLLMSGATFAQQQFPASLNLAVKESSTALKDSLSINPDLSYYARNYEKAFRQDYNLNVLAYAASSLFMDNFRSIWSDPDTPQVFKVLPLPGVNVDAFLADPREAGYPTQPKR